MANKILILGESGTGKSYSLRTLDPKTTFIICPDEKAMPFKGWKTNYKEIKTEQNTTDAVKSNFYTGTSPDKILKLLQFISDKRPDIKVIAVDTISLMMVASFMEQIKIKGWEKYSEQALDVWTILKTINKLRDDLTVVITAHVEKDRDGCIDFFVPGGTLIKEKAKPVTMFTVVLETVVDFINNMPNYKFLTQNNGKNVAKSPASMFPSLLIENDMAYVIDCMQKYEESSE